jgi:hypothetical protein
MGVTHGISEEPYASRKAMVEALIHHFGAPEVRNTCLVWNPTLIATREAREAAASRPRSTKRPDGSTPGAFGRTQERPNELREAAEELGIDLSGVRKEDS